MLPFDYVQPTRIVFGKGRISSLVSCAVLRRAPSFLLLTVSWRSTGWPKVAKDALDGAGLTWHLFTDVSCPTPRGGGGGGGAQAVDNGRGLRCGTKKSTSLSALGGGSAMDTAKALAVGLSHPGGIWDYVNEPNRPVKGHHQTRHPACDRHSHHRGHRRGIHAHGGAGQYRRPR